MSNETDVISEVANELVVAVEEAMKDLPGTANNMPFVQLLIEYKEMMELFEAQQNAYYRATELWRSKTPGKERTFLDVGNLTLFLLEQNDEQAAEIEALEAKLAAAEKSNEWLRQCLADIRVYALDANHWAIGNACDDALATGAGSLEALEPKDGEL